MEPVEKGCDDQIQRCERELSRWLQAKPVMRRRQEEREPRSAQQHDSLHFIRIRLVAPEHWEERE